MSESKRLTRNQSPHRVREVCTGEEPGTEIQNPGEVRRSTVRERQ